LIKFTILQLPLPVFILRFLKISLQFIDLRVIQPKQLLRFRQECSTLLVLLIAFVQNLFLLLQERFMDRHLQFLRFDLVLSTSFCVKRKSYASPLLPSFPRKSPQKSSLQHSPYLSSPEIYLAPESYHGHLNSASYHSAFSQATRSAETLCHTYHTRHSMQVAIARVFDTYGPRMVTTRLNPDGSIPNDASFLGVCIRKVQ
jgi:hypothetical protein